MADEIVDIGELPAELKKAKSEGAFVRVWATPDGKIQGKAYTQAKVPPEVKRKNTQKRLDKWKGRKADAETRLKDFNGIDLSIHGGLARSKTAIEKDLAEANDKIRKYEKKLKEIA